MVPQEHSTAVACLGARFAALRTCRALCARPQRAICHLSPTGWAPTKKPRRAPVGAHPVSDPNSRFTTRRPQGGLLQKKAALCTCRSSPCERPELAIYHLSPTGWAPTKKPRCAPVGALCARPQRAICHLSPTGWAPTKKPRCAPVGAHPVSDPNSRFTTCRPHRAPTKKPRCAPAGAHPVRDHNARFATRRPQGGLLQKSAPTRGCRRNHRDASCNQAVSSASFDASMSLTANSSGGRCWRTTAITVCASISPR